MIHGKHPLTPTAERLANELRDRVTAGAQEYIDGGPLTALRDRVTEATESYFAALDTAIAAPPAKCAHIDPEYRQNYPQPIFRSVTSIVREARGALSLLRRASAGLERRVHDLSEAERNWRLAPTAEALQQAETRLVEALAQARSTIVGLPDWLLTGVR